MARSRAPGNVVGFYKLKALANVRRAVGFERPDFHLAETLPAELRFAAELAAA